MAEKMRLKVLVGVTLLYTIVFAILAVLRKNYEFLFYFVFLLIIITFIAFYHKELHLPYCVLVALSVLAALHFAGGIIHVSGTRLYDVLFFGGILRYDNIAHVVGGFIFAFVAYNLLRPHLDLKARHNPFLLASIVVLMGLGFGTLNEIVELFAVVFFQGDWGVGGYMNNAMDLVYNMVGAISASIAIVRYHRKIDKLSL